MNYAFHLTVEKLFVGCARINYNIVYYKTVVTIEGKYYGEKG